MHLTPTLAEAALQPHLEMNRRQSLSWGMSFLSAKDRKKLAEEWEYNGADVPREHARRTEIEPPMATIRRRTG